MTPAAIALQAIREVQVTQLIATQSNSLLHVQPSVIKPLTLTPSKRKD